MTATNPWPTSWVENMWQQCCGYSKKLTPACLWPTILNLISLDSSWIHLTDFGVKFTIKHPTYKEFPLSTYMTATNPRPTLKAQVRGVYVKASIKDERNQVNTHSL